MSSCKITCPYCWQSIDIEEPTQSDMLVEFVADCEVCCRPILITATWEDGDDEPYITAEPES